jgi:hypothetical protein
MAKKLPEGEWEHSLLLSAIDAAHDWSLRPSALDICKPEDDMSFMQAYLNTKRQMERVDYEIAKERQEAETRSKRLKGKGGRSGRRR